MLDASILNEVKTLIGDGLTCPPNIQGLNEVIELKDSVIFIQRESIKDLTKKKKRRKLGEIIAGIGLLTLLIVK